MKKKKKKLRKKSQLKIFRSLSRVRAMFLDIANKYATMAQSTAASYSSLKLWWGNVCQTSCREQPHCLSTYRYSDRQQLELY